MIVKQELVKKIKDYFSLNIYETKVWLALLGKGIASAGEIAELSGVPRSRTYDVLESLEKQGFAIAKLGKPVKYIAVKPTIVVEKLKLDTLNDAHERVEVLSKLKETKEYTELQELHNSSSKPIKQNEMSTAIRGRQNVYSHIREMLENSENEIIICTNASDMDERSRVFNGLFKRLKDAGIKLKIFLKGTDEEIKKISDRFKIKTEKTDLNARFFISDRKQVMFLITNSDEEQEIGIWLDSDFFVKSLACLFDMAMRK